MLTFRALTFGTPNLRNAYKYITHTLDITCLYSSPPDARDVRISTRNIFPYKRYTDSATDNLTVTLHL